jgi:hypothetical protein
VGEIREKVKIRFVSACDRYPGLMKLAGGAGFRRSAHPAGTHFPNVVKNEIVKACKTLKIKTSFSEIVTKHAFKPYETLKIKMVFSRFGRAAYFQSLRNFDTQTDIFQM